MDAIRMHARHGATTITSGIAIMGMKTANACLHMQTILVATVISKIVYGDAMEVMAGTATMGVRPVLATASNFQ